MHFLEAAKHTLSRCCEAVEGACETCSQRPVSRPVSMPVRAQVQRAAMTEIHRPHRFSDRLDADWQHTATARRTVRTIRSWAAHVPTADTARFDQLTDAQELIDATQRSDGDAGNSLLLLLVELARHDALAGRIVVQRLLPGLISAAAKYRFLSETGDPVEEAVSAAWIAIRNYDINRRTRHVAAGLISDAIYLAFRRDARRQVPAETPTEPRLLGERVACPPSPALVELADVVRTARLAGVAAHDLDLIRALVCTGSPGAVARQQCVTPRTIRNRRDRAIRRLQQAVAVAA
ncbi:MAG: hypothetical protein ACI83Y_001314 [Candidatus Azotimanducaceae bacterium]|jgi:hypothetical protein